MKEGVGGDLIACRMSRFLQADRPSPDRNLSLITSPVSDWAGPTLARTKVGRSPGITREGSKQCNLTSMVRPPQGRKGAVGRRKDHYIREKA